MARWLQSGMAALSALLLLCTAVPAIAEPNLSAGPDQAHQAPPPSRIIAIGDLHGDHAAFRAIVEAAGLVGANGAWIGGDAILVQTGDVPDRGPDSLLILRDLMRLQGEAAAAGGRVVALIGNHEAMNVIGDLRYVHEGEYAAFREQDSECRRRRYYRSHQHEIERIYRRSQPSLSEDQIHRLWLQQTPLGGAELLMAWAPEGEIGQWLAENPAVVLIGGALFAHGGISANYAGLSIAEINERTSAAIVARDVSPQAIINDPAGPLWYRGYFLRGEADERTIVLPVEAAPEVDLVLAAYGAQRIVVGHTPSLRGIRILLDGRLIAIDTGISAHYGGARSYLEIRGDAVVAHIVREEGSP
jgi:hypothetical protein